MTKPMTWQHSHKSRTESFTAQLQTVSLHICLKCSTSLTEQPNLPTCVQFPTAQFVLTYAHLQNKCTALGQRQSQLCMQAATLVYAELPCLLPNV